METYRIPAVMIFIQCNTAVTEHWLWRSYGKLPKTISSSSSSSVIVGVGKPLYPHRWLYLIVTSADQKSHFFGQVGSVPCIGYMPSIAIQGTALDYL